MVRDRTHIDDIALVFGVSDPDSPKPNTVILLKIVSGSSFCWIRIQTQEFHDSSFEKICVEKSLDRNCAIAVFLTPHKGDLQSPGEASRKGISYFSPFLGMICLSPDFDSRLDSDPLAVRIRTIASSFFYANIATLFRRIRI
jgi:hypothetical protein